MKRILMVLVLVGLLAGVARAGQSIPTIVNNAMEFTRHVFTSNTSTYRHKEVYFRDVRDYITPDDSTGVAWYNSPGYYTLTVKLTGGSAAGDTVYIYAMELDPEGNVLNNETVDIQLKDGTTVTDVTETFYALKDVVYGLDLYLSGFGKGYRFYIRTAGEAWTVTTWGRR
jgi:hypothetical protein